MSFTNNPFRNVNFRIQNNGCIRWECDSCGGESEDFVATISAFELAADFQAHVRESHGRTPVDFEGWH